jgi:UDP-N-acetylmuramate--alanine ligase
MSILDYNNFYLVGIKGVAMTSIAQILMDAKKNISGSDVKENFVTEGILKKLNANISIGFDSKIPEDIDCVIYTAAHKGEFNPQVITAQNRGIKTYSHAEAQAEFFNMKKGIAVCGVGGKSTVSAMIAWILEKTGLEPSFSVGVGDIPGLNKTAQWDSDTNLFVAEADEYVTDPSAPSRNKEITPRFSYLNPFTTVCTNLQFDHPDVYRDFDHTKEVFFKFFNQIADGGFLILNQKDLKHKHTTSAQETITFGNNQSADFYYKQIDKESRPGTNVGLLKHKEQKYKITLKVPGIYNLKNAVAAIAACTTVGVEILSSIQALESFNSTKRRFELVGVKNGITYYDDYAHHPNEITSVIEALNKWYPKAKKVIAFQPHTYSRTKKLLSEFIDSFKMASTKTSSEVVLLDIFASAREAIDSTISSNDIVEGVEKKFNDVKISNLKTIHNLSLYLENNLEPGSVILTVGAGDIYKVHDLL